MSRLAVPQVGQRDAKEVIKPMNAGVVAVILMAPAVETKVPFSWRREEIKRSWNLIVSSVEATPIKRPDKS